VLAAIGIIAAATAMASASAPSLPPRTAAQLVAEAIQAASKPPGPFTATVQETADFGLPQLPQLPQASQSGAAADLTSGTQTVNIWYRDPQHLRIAHPVPAGESDVRINGRTVWLWNSKTQTATKITLPAQANLPGSARNGPAAGTCPPGSSNSACATPTPQAAANQALKALGPSTLVAVESNVKAPTGPAYQLALEPRTSQSLIGKVVIVIDAKTHLPVSVEVFGRGSAGLIFSIGFSSLSFGAPAASNFSFTPPPGATVKTQVVPGSVPPGLLPPGLGSPPMGLKTGQAPAIPKQALAQIKAQFVKSLPASMSKAQRAAAIKQFDQQFTAAAGQNAVNVPGQSTPNSGGGLFNVNDGGIFGGAVPVAGAAPKTIGKDWLTVIATPADPQVSAAVNALLKDKLPAQPSTGNGLFGSSSSSSASASSGSVPGSPVPPQARPDLAVLRALLLAATPVHGSWGSGRLLQTKVASVLITSKGQILFGAVTPAVLYADVPAAG